MSPEEAKRKADEKFPALVRERHYTSDRSFEEMEMFRQGCHYGYMVGLVEEVGEDNHTTLPR